MGELGKAGFGAMGAMDGPKTLAKSAGLLF
jgi:hypothetical protein